jgi:hypothetical protein
MHCGTSGGSYNTTTQKMTCDAGPTADYNATSVAAAVAVAAAAERVVLVVGNGLQLAAEGHDASNISFPDGQSQLIQAVAAAAKHPVVVVTMTASALDIADILQNPKVGAVLHAGEPADSSLGVADCIFGAKVPAGRTIQTVYPNGTPAVARQATTAYSSI